MLVLLLSIAPDAAAQRWKVGDSVDLEDMKVMCHRRIARHIDMWAPDFSVTLPSGQLLTNENTKGRFLVFMIWHPSNERNKEMLPHRPSTMLCPILELAQKDSNLLFTSIVPDTPGLALKNKPCAGGTIPYALASPEVMRSLSLGVGQWLLLIIGKDGKIINAVCAFDMIFYKNEDYRILTESIRKLLG